MDNGVIKNKPKVNPIILLTILTITLISIRWLIIYSLFPNEPLINKVIFDLEDHLYFPFIFNLSNLNFIPDYLVNFTPEKIIPFPIYSFIIHAAVYFFFNEYSFIIVEYFSFFFFIYIFYKIFKELNINIYISIIFALVIFLIPEFFIYFKKLEINLINFDIIQNLYGFRIPRPIISNIYFFWGLLLAIQFNKYKKEKYFFILLGVNLALNFGSFFYYFIILSILFFILFCNKILKNNKDFFFDLLKNILISFTSFLIFAFPFITILILSEKDYALRVGLFHPNIEQKIVLIEYIFFKFLSLKFLSIFFLNTFYLLFLLNKQNFFCKKTITVIYLLFVSSCVAPILFIIVSPNLTEIYHFINCVVFLVILLSIIFSFLALATFLLKNTNNYHYHIFMLKNKYYFLSLIFLIPLVYNFNYFLNYKQNIIYDFRNDMNILYKYLNKNKKNINNILTFNSKIQVWWILLGNNQLSTVHSLFTSLKTNEHELNFINNLKFLNISKNNFSNIIKNKKAGWRYRNDYFMYFSSYTYQANSLITYKNSKNFENEILTFIKNSSPLHTQQLVLPKEQTDRLIRLFNDADNSYIESPDMIILEKNTQITKYSNINKKNYCKLKNSKYLDIYLNLKKSDCNII